MGTYQVFRILMQHELKLSLSLSLVPFMFTNVLPSDGVCPEYSLLIYMNMTMIANQAALPNKSISDYIGLLLNTIRVHAPIQLPFSPIHALGTIRFLNANIIKIIHCVSILDAIN
jgi:hypothetical protein